MINLLLTAYLPVPTPSLPQHDDTFRGVLHDMLDEICALSGKLELSLGEYGTFKPAIEFLEHQSSEDQADLEQWFEPYDLDNCCGIIKIMAEVPIPTPEVELGIKMLSWETFSRLAITEAEFIKGIYDLIVVANIARVGSLEIDRGVIVGRDGQLSARTNAMSAYSLREASNFAASIGWPTLQRLDFAKVWNWAMKQEGFLKRFGGGPTGRAINAFTYSFEAIRTDPRKLFWALVGIEALYVKGPSVMEQVREKVWLFLGAQDSHKKKISQLYNFRSRFVHGDLDFPGMYFLHRATPSFDEYTDELHESVSLAEAILVATIQELVQRDWKGLSFSYTMSDLPE
jgi:hypothetical protein